MMVPVMFHGAERYDVIQDALTDETKTFFAQAWGCTRKLHNLYVDYYLDALESKGYKSGDDIPRVTLPKVTYFSHQKEYHYLKDTDSLALANVKNDFSNSVKRFREQSDHTAYTKRALRRAESGTEPLSLRGLKGMPKFHAKSQKKDSYTTNNQHPGEGKTIKQDTIRLEGNLLHLPKIEQGIPLVIHRPLPENAVIGNVTISRTPDGHIYASISYTWTVMMDLAIHDAVRADDSSILDTLSFLGLDYSQKDFYVDSEGRKANYPRYYRKSEEKLGRLQEKLSRMEPGSNNYNKTLDKIRKLHAKIANQRKDFLQKLSTKIVQEYDVVVVEDINLRAMGECLHFGKNLHDNGFGMFREMLAYKLERKGSFLIKISRTFPSSQKCHKCGNKNPAVKDMNIRFWECPVCGHSFQRDRNAAINIREEGKRIFLSDARRQLEEVEEAKTKAENKKAARKKKSEENKSKDTKSSKKTSRKTSKKKESAA